MGSGGKELLRERIRNKRASEGLDDIPQEELFAKKPKYEMTPEERERQAERRKRNKEAAEKSRRRKKEEFEKLQMENDQLNQDKCEMAAMIEKLKGDLHSVGKENRTLRQQSDQLKRWIGKRADSLGLVKHGKQGEKSTDRSVLRGDPSLHPAAVSDGHVTKVGLPAPASPALSTRSLSPPSPANIDTQPAAFRTSTTPRQQLTPWLVETPVNASGQHQQVGDVVSEGIFRPQPPQAKPVVPAQGQGQSLQVGEEQQVVYLPKNAILIVQGDEGSHYLPAPMMPQVTMAIPQLVVGAPLAHSVPAAVPRVVTSVAPLVATPVAPPGTQPVNALAAPQLQAEDLTVSKSKVVAEPHGDMLHAETTADDADQGERSEDKVKATGDTEETSAKDTSLATAIESLLKLGYKVKGPREEEVVVQSPMEMETMVASVVTVPVDTPESAVTVTMATSTSSRTNVTVGPA